MKQIDLNSRKNPQELEILKKVEPVVNSMGYDLRDLEVLGSARSPIVRVTLDKKILKMRLLALKTARKFISFWGLCLMSGILFLETTPWK